MTDTVQEPSMEEILASIRRIISEDGERTGGEPGTAAATEVEAEREPEGEDDVFDLSDRKPLEFGALFEQLRSEKAGAQPTLPGPPPRLDDGLVSPSQAQETMESFSRLNEKLNEDYHDLPIGNGAITLERLTRELMRPMLKEWLDQHLPIMVERLVREEMERLVMQSQRRDP
jgi:cell pole-organizing protein PopZ